ncbi:MAG: hypothetical protein R3244_10210, partial [Thermoanaerobaculia bacterium]|nr:hypothetical protein [Thermoanaerobaculia bacterium]
MTLARLHRPAAPSRRIVERRREISRVAVLALVVVAGIPMVGCGVPEGKPGPPVAGTPLAET